MVTLRIFRKYQNPVTDRSPVPDPGLRFCNCQTTPDRSFSEQAIVRPPRTGVFGGPTMAGPGTPATGPGTPATGPAPVASPVQFHLVQFCKTCEKQGALQYNRSKEVYDVIT
jgi:hypothetical protein